MKSRQHRHRTGRWTPIVENTVLTAILGLLMFAAVVMRQHGLI